MRLLTGVFVGILPAFFYSCQGDNGGIVIERQGSLVNVTGLELPAHVEHCFTVTHTFSLNGKQAVNYTTEYDTINYVPRWVAFKFYKEINQSSVKRSDDGFHNDPDLPRRFWLGDNAYFPGYDRGHMCASADRVVSRSANDQTFYFTNVIPQNGDFNQRIWAALEYQVRNWRERFDTLYVVRGGILPADGKRITVSGKKMAVPSKCWMALLGRNVSVSGDQFAAIAFCLENKAYGGDWNFATHATTISNAAMSIDDLEKLTGIDFFPALPDELETSVEKNMLKGAWNGLK